MVASTLSDELLVTKSVYGEGMFFSSRCMLYRLPLDDLYFRINIAAYVLLVCPERCGFSVFVHRHFVGVPYSHQSQTTKLLMLILTCIYS